MAFNENPRMSHHPIGTVEEVQAIGLDPAQVRTCSRALDNRNKGCRFFGHEGGCRFRELWNAKGGPVGPENRGFYKIISDTGATQGYALPCFAIMETSSERMEQAKKLGEIYSQFRVPGETIKRNVSEKLHVKKDPDCQACQKNDCNKMHMVTHEIVIRPFERPAERFKGTIFQNEIQDELLDTVDFDARMGGLVAKKATKDETVARDSAAQGKPTGLEGLKRGG